MFNKSFLLFLAGCFTMTQIKIIGYIGITELVFFFVAPFVFIKNAKLLKRHGFTRVLVFSGLWMVNGLITDWYQQNSFENTIKGFAVTYCVFSSLIVLHDLLWADVWRVRWAVLGFTVSVVLSIFVFQGGAHVEKALATGESMAGATLSYKLTLLSIVGSCLAVPIVFFYKKAPYISAGLALFIGAFGLMQGGRAAFLVSLMSVGLMVFVLNSQVRMARIQRSFYGLGIIMILAGALASASYKYVVKRGMMGEEEQSKYEQQSVAKIGLLSGRSAIIGSTLAITDSPLLGYGSWALDWDGYNQRAADIAGIEYRERAGGVSYMPGHSHVFGSWVQNGLFGGIFWIYILILIYKTVKFNMGVVPQLFGYLALTVPALIWNILFSPFAARIITLTAITVFLLLDLKRYKEAFPQMSRPGRKRAAGRNPDMALAGRAVR